MTKRITLAEALCGVQFSVQTLDGRTLQINTQDQIIQPGSHKSIA
jgi:DnaJ-class molecular chaperone